jgi:hypothetical protein
MTLFTKQFDLFKTGEQLEGFYKNNVSYIDSPTTYNVEAVTPENMYPNNYFDLLNNSKFVKNSGPRRDNTIIINDYHSNEIGERIQPKNEIKSFTEVFKNDNAQAGSFALSNHQNSNLQRYSGALNIKNNDYDASMYIRPESIDGIPMTDIIRPQEKTQEQLRGLGVNSIRLDPNGRTNQTGLQGEGKSLDPLKVNLTKFKMKSYVDQSVEDYLKTTGQYIKPDWRSKVKLPATDRTLAKQMVGPSIAVNGYQEYRNEQPANPTQKEDILETDYISGTRAVNDKQVYYNNNTINPTIREDTSLNTYISNPRNIADKTSFHNNNALNPTIREDTSNIEYLSNTKSIVNHNSYHNNNSLNPTIREDTSNIEYLSNTKSIVDHNSYRNNNSANPTIREETSNIGYISNTKSIVDHNSYRNNNSALPTIREETSYNDYISNTKSVVDHTSYHNNNSANPTIREQTSYNDYMSNTKSVVDHTSYHNNNSANPTIREQTSYNDYISNTKSVVDHTSYHNNNSANPTIREQTNNNDFTGPSNNINRSIVYENNQPTNPTLRILTENNDYTGPGVTSRTYQKNPDKTRSGYVEEVLPRDYMGGTAHYVLRSESRKILDTYKQNETIEKSIDQTNRTLVGGTDQISAGKNNVGEYKTTMKRDLKNYSPTSRIRTVANSYIEEIPITRGNLLLEQRSEINPYLNKTLNGNPFINNIVHHSINAEHDYNREGTLLNDREVIENINHRHN